MQALMEERINLFKHLLPPGENVKFEGPKPPVKEKIPIPEKTRLDDIVRVKFISKSIYSFRNPLKSQTTMPDTHLHGYFT